MFTVGAGSAGSVLAARLSEDSDKTVLLLEAGEDDSGNILMSIPFMSFALQHSSFDWNFYTERQQHSSTDLVEEVS